MNEGMRFDLVYETMPWHKVDAVVFDIGNILIRFAPDDFLQQLFPGDEAMQQHMLQNVYKGPYWPCFDRGTMTYREAAQRLSAEGPQILIIHTHGTEAYLPAAGEEYTPSDPYRTTDPERSVIRVGDALCSALEEYGLRVLHDRTLYDYPSYAGSYERAAASIEAYLAEYPDIALVLDVHRDAIGDASTVYKTCAAANGTAQVMLVCGTDEYLEHPLWRENLKLALAMQAAAMSANGALMRPIHLAPERYNQQYTTGSLIIEVGTNGNTLSEALAAAELFGRAAGEMLASLAAAD